MHCRGRAELTLGLDEVVVAPFSIVAVRLPLLVCVEQCEVIRLGHKELLSRCITLLCPAPSHTAASWCQSF